MQENLINLVEQAIEIDLINPEESTESGTHSTTLKNSYCWVNLNGSNILIKTEVYHSWCKIIAKEVRILANDRYFNEKELAIIYHLISMYSQTIYQEKYDCSNVLQ